MTYFAWRISPTFQPAEITGQNRPGLSFWLNHNLKPNLGSIFLLGMIPNILRIPKQVKKPNHDQFWLGFQKLHFSRSHFSLFWTRFEVLLEYPIQARLKPGLSTWEAYLHPNGRPQAKKSESQQVEEGGKPWAKPGAKLPGKTASWQLDQMVLFT